MASSGTEWLSEYFTSKLYLIVSKKTKHGEDRSAYVQSFQNSVEKDRFEGLGDLPVCDSASILPVLIRISPLFLAMAELVRRASVENMDNESYVEIWKFRETSKVSRLDPYIITRTEHTKTELNILEPFLEYYKEHDYEHLKITVSPAGCGSRQFGSTSVAHSDNDRCQGGKKLNDHTGTDCKSFRGLRKQS